MTQVQFVFCLHNHQPVDNFEEVFLHAFDRSYLPFLDRIERRPSLRFAVHYSGPLLEWLLARRPEFLGRLRALSESGRMEILGGGFFEPVFPMLPDEDAVGQIRWMSDFLKRHFGREPEGLWLPERVWEQTLVPVLARAGMRYTVLDDFHFKAAGVPPESLTGYFLTEDRGSLLRVFPLQEELRYAIPYRSPEETVAYLLKSADATGARTLVYADDGEKFGLWPDTYRHVYEEGWLDRFFDALEKNADRIRTTTFRDVIRKDPPAGRVSLPSASYREMGEWALPAEAQARYEETVDILRRAGRFEASKHFLPGAPWRGFRMKYPEANLMYGRMLTVSRRLRAVPEEAPGRRKAQEELYRGQCNCGYWHGVFGGLYLPHLRGAIYRHLIASENALERDAAGADLGHERLDLDLDGREDLRLYNRFLNVFVTPATGGQIAEVDSRETLVNLAATLARRPEHYHSKIRAATPPPAEGEARSIHDRVISKVADLDRHLVYDGHLRGWLVDRLFRPDAKPEEAERDEGDLGDFAQGEYAHEVVPKPDWVVASLRREGRAGDGRVAIEKEIALPLGASEILVRYTVKALDPLEARFGVESNLAMLPPDAPAGELFGHDSVPVGSLSDRRQVSGTRLAFRESWYGLSLELLSSTDADFWIYPVHTVSQSETGFELTYQGTVLMPTWQLKLKAGESWTAVLTWKIDARRKGG